MAETLTDKLKLSKRDTGDINWGQGANSNLDAVDQHAQQATLRPPRTLLASLGSGAVGANLLGSTTYFYKVIAVNAAGETTESKIPAVVEAQVTESASPVPVILSWETVKGATGYKIYKSTLSGQEKFLASVAGESTAIYTDDGNTAVNGAISVPAANTARTSVSKIVAGTNVTINPPDGTGDVTVNAASPAPSDASDTVKGVTKLSVAPAVAANPIAVGDNDSRNTNARTPTGAAGGDLSGTYPDPGVAKVNGTSVPASPSAGQVLTATGPTAAQWQTPSGGYVATVTVAAPTGVAATDTAAINAAIGALPAGGGRVLFREGTYAVTPQLVIPASKPIWIMGQGKSTILQPAVFGNGIFKGPALGNIDGLTFSDFHVDGSVSAGVGVIDLQPATGQTFDKIKVQRVTLTNGGRIVNILATTGTGKVTNVAILDCVSIDPQANGGLIFCNVAATGNASKIIVANNHVTQDAVIGIPLLQISGNDFLIQNNYLEQPGGAIGNGIISFIGTTTKSVIIGNVFVGASAVGTGISATISDCVFSGNVADTLSAFVNSFAFQGTTISNCTITGNKCALPINLGASSSNNVVVGNKGTISGGAVSDTIASTYLTSIKKIGSADIVGAATLTPGSGITLTQGGNDITIAAAGGGYASAVVAAPSGVAATDTSNIQSAIDSVSVAGGGTVILREGIYQISTTINPKSGVTIRGQGKSTVQNTGLSGTSGGGSPSGTTLRGTTGLGLTKMIADAVSVPINVTFRDLNLDFGKVARGSITGQDMVMHGSNLTFINVTFIMMASVGNPSVDITPTNINDIGKNKFIGCDFYDAGTAATVAFQLDGQITGCYFEGTVATFSELLNFFSGSIVGCYFATNIVYNTALIRVAPNNNGPATVNITGCYFKQFLGTQTDAIRVDNITPGVVSITGNTAHSTAVGQIRVLASAGKRVVVGNCGFNAYSGGDQAGNDGQSAINSGGVAGGDLSGTYPNPTVAKVNGTAVPASPSAGQVLTATGPTAATWQAPASGGYAKVVVAAPTGVAATDTANIQAALTTAASAPGGVVILREGTYVVNNTLTLASRVTLQGQGMRDVTIIRADDAMGNVAIIAGAASAIAPEVRDLAIDGRHFFRGTKTVADIRFDQSTSKVVLRRVRLVNPAGIDSVWGSSLAIANGGMVIGCDFFIAGAVAAVFLSSNNFLEVKDSVFDLAVAGTQNVISIAAEGVISKNTFQTQQSLLDAIIKFGSGVEAGRAVVSGNRFNASVVNTSAIKFNQAITARATIYGNVAATTAPGNITVTNTVAAIVGNVGFASYVGGSQMVGNV